MKNIQNAFVGPLRTLDFFDQKTKKLDLGETFNVVRNVQQE